MPNSAHSNYSCDQYSRRCDKIVEGSIHKGLQLQVQELAESNPNHIDLGIPAITYSTQGILNGLDLGVEMYASDVPGNIGGSGNSCEQCQKNARKCLEKALSNTTPKVS